MHVFKASLYRSLQLGMFEQLQQFNQRRTDHGAIGIVSTCVAVGASHAIATPFSYPIILVSALFVLIHC
jgi:hypothetical protein